MIALTTLLDAVSWISIVICLYFAYSILTKPEIERKHVIRNNIQAIVEGERLMNSADKIVLMKKQLDSLKLEEIPEWQQRAYVNAVLEKFGFKPLKLKG